MMIRILTGFLLSILYLNSFSIFATEIRIESTSIKDDACVKIAEDEDSGAEKYKCPGVDGFGLFVLYDDSRMSLDVIYPDGNVYSIDLWDKVTQSFFYLDESIEWRIHDNKNPVEHSSIIIGVNSANAEMPEKHWWVTIRLSVNNVCVTDILDKKIYSIDNAREFSDTPSTSCLSF